MQLLTTRITAGTRILALTLAGVLASPLTACGEQDVPNLEKRIQEFEASQGPSPLSDQDKSVMDEAKQQLEAQMPDPGLKVGETAPDFTLPNARREPVHLYELLKQGPVVLTFYRGAWCPYCNLQLRALRETLPEIQTLGATLVAVTPQTPDVSLKQVEKDNYPFEILSDLENTVMKNYRLHFELPQDLNALYLERFRLDLADYNGEGRYVLPVPGTYVIDTQGIVRSAFAAVDYKRRMEPAAILSALRELKTTRTTSEKQQNGKG